MRRAAVAATVVMFAVLLLLPASAVAGLGFTVQVQAPADRLIPAWYRNGRLESLTATRTGRLTWSITLPPTSGRLLLGFEFDLDDGQPVCCTREMRLEMRSCQPPPSPPAAGGSPSPSRRRSP